MSSVRIVAEQHGWGSPEAQAELHAVAWLAKRIYAEAPEEGWFVAWAWAGMIRAFALREDEADRFRADVERDLASLPVTEPV